MMITPTPHTMGSEMKLKTSRNAQKTKYATGTRRFTWGAASGSAGHTPKLSGPPPTSLGVSGHFWELRPEGPSWPNC